jgi:xanthine dehydrogenase YagT iron-sulfur-binding subunit
MTIDHRHATGRNCEFTFEGAAMQLDVNARIKSPAASETPPAAEGVIPLTLRINGSEHRLRLDPRTTLLDCLREALALTGTKKGCDHAAFLARDAYQCGYCTSGQIMSAVALLEEPCGPHDADVRECMSGNICRCGAYPNIVAAIQQARGKS